MKQLMYKSIAVLALLVNVGLYAQKQTKKIKEVFNVDKNAVLDLDTNNADIEFDTWNKNVIQIEATIEVEGMTADEAEKYFIRNKMDILGNSSKVSVSTGGNKFFSKTTSFANAYPVHFNTSNFPARVSFDMDTIRMDSIVLDFDLKDVKFADFDYEEYQKGGKEYIQKWQKEFQKDMGAKNEAEIKKWVAEVKKKAEITQKQAKIIREKHKEIAEKHKLIAEKVKAKVIKAQQNGDVFYIDSNEFYTSPNTFYISKGGDTKSLKVKKTIKIKMPKSATIKMDVRHGKVKLAENTTNINANLSYASLLATTINGDKTYVNASYSPVYVSNWNVGQLKTSYAKAIDLKTVNELTLSAVSSNITINELLKSAFITNDFGDVEINSVSSSFEDLDVTITNGNLNASLPKSSYSIYVKGKSSKVALPVGLSVNKSVNQNIIVHKGFNASNNTNKSVNINASYSDVVLK